MKKRDSEDKKTSEEKKIKDAVTRRQFIKTSATAGTATIVTIAGLSVIEAHGEITGEAFAPAAGRGPASCDPEPEGTEHSTSKTNRVAVLFAVGDTLIPSAQGDPGYRDLEWYGISEEVNRRLDMQDDDFTLFNESSVDLFGKPFIDLPEEKRAAYFAAILKAGSFKDDEKQKKLKEIYSHIREISFTVYYQNFPEDHWPRDTHRVPLLRAGDQYQVTNPSTPGIITGWDITGYPGPLTWEEEERRRAIFKKIDWQE